MTEPGSHTSGLDRRIALLGVVATGLAVAVAAAPTRAEIVEASACPEDEGFMRLALDQAALAEFPFGAVIVRDGAVLAEGHNMRRVLNDPTAHGEIVTIRCSCESRDVAELAGATLYTPGEPCPMCMSAIVWSGIGRVVFAASIDRLATKLDQIMVPCAEIAARSPFARVEVTGGVLADEAMALFG